MRHARNAASLTRRGFVGGLAAAPIMGAAASLPTITVMKDPTCDCCAGWMAHVGAAGFAVEVVETNDLTSVKTRLGVPGNLEACHTAEVEGYVIEGHVPATVMKHMLMARPRIRGLAVRGMPVGSPGMEIQGAEPETYDVIAFGPDGQSRYARFRGANPV